jgi:hypothetical protein
MSRDGEHQVGLVPFGWHSLGLPAPADRRPVRGREGLGGEPVPHHGRRIGYGRIPHHIHTTKEVRNDDTHAGGGIRPPRRGARSG